MMSQSISILNDRLAKVMENYTMLLNHTVVIGYSLSDETMRALQLTEEQLTFLLKVINTVFFDGIPSAHGKMLCRSKSEG